MNENKKITQTITNVAIFRLLYLTSILCSNLKVWTKIILIAAFDYFEGRIICLFANQEVNFNSNNYYQSLDKFNDTLENGIILYLIYSNKLLSTNYIKLLSFAYFYRVIGITLNLVFKKNRKILLYFPDIFKELLLISYLSQFKFNNNIKLFIILLLLTIMIKIYIEYLFHCKKV
jgi:hypothetical protein